MLQQVQYVYLRVGDGGAVRGGRVEEPADWVTKLAPCEALVGADCTRLLDAVATLCPALHSHGAWLGENCSHADDIPWISPDSGFQTPTNPPCTGLQAHGHAGRGGASLPHGKTRRFEGGGPAQPR